MDKSYLTLETKNPIPYILKGKRIVKNFHLCKFFLQTSNEFRQLGPLEF